MEKKYAFIPKHIYVLENDTMWRTTFKQLIILQNSTSSVNSSEYKDRFLVANCTTELELRCWNDVM